MQLTKLEVKGFKSFGDKIVIHFDEGITGIVGPNGCGKSNVVDAIRWVLGEQKTRALRSDKMENVIFNGTKSRKPTQMAEVSLTFNNTKNLLPTEYSQVTITRRYYRSGDSEYLLNGVNCRLKDITNLFLDTGIASNSYAIIELKMVDDILNDKDNSRRGLFEEAAGISKFRIRKKETFRKLEDTDADLARVEDLLYEINKNLKSLEKQARQAQHYYKVKEAYKALSILLAKKSVGKHLDAFNDLDRQLEVENDRKINLNKQIKEKDAQVEKEKANIIYKEKLLASRQKTLNEHVNKIRQFESDKKIKNERLRYLTDKSETLKNQMGQDRQSNERAHFSIQSLVHEKSSAEKLFLETQQSLETFRQEFESQKAKTNRLQAEMNELNLSYRSRQEEVYQLKKSLEIKQIQLSALKQELEKVASDTTVQSAGLEEFEEKTHSLSSRIREKEIALQALAEAEAEVQLKIQSYETQQEAIREQAASQSRKLDAIQNEYNLTKSLVENLEGFPEAIKFLKKNATWGKQTPLLSDIIACDEKYRVPIENYLEHYMNYYVVESEAQAYQAVNLLSDASKGKANFFILNKFLEFHATPPAKDEGALAAINIVEYDARYANLISYLLHHVYIIKEAFANIPEDDSSIFISDNAKFIRRRFSISGGSVGLFEGKRIGRAKNLEKLERQIKELTKVFEHSQTTLLKNQQELSQWKQGTHKIALETLQREINLLHQEHIAVKTKQEQFASMLNSISYKKEDMDEKMQDLSEEIYILQPKVSQAQGQFAVQEENIRQLNESLSVESQLLSQKSALYNQENIVFHQRENKVNSINQEIAFKESAYESSKQRIGKNQGDLQQNEAEIKKLLEGNEVQDDDLIAMYAEKDNIEAAVNEAEKDYYASRGEADQLESQCRVLQRARENADDLIMEIRHQANETKLLLNTIKERLSVEFNLDLDQLMAQGPDEKDIDEDELKRQVSATKGQLDKMGPINPMAMEAYEEIKERNDFIIEQRDDLIKAKESLLSTIAEIDKVAKETFLNAFYKIKENFIKVFRSLFTEEDDCDLKLSDPTNPLEASIDIIAKPKGKRPLTINQLSGGEKTLTATSLLFAIYLLKPAPFCIFDEVDAPLDDANIDKFNQIIKKFSKESQFIIVTHNKRTMASTDVIYGITMVEQGVSRVVPVDLREIA